MGKSPDGRAPAIGAGDPTHAPGVTVAPEPGRDTEAVRGAEQKPETKRLTANLPLDAARDLAETAEATGFNKLTTLVRAIRVFAELVKVDRAGGEIIIKEADGSRSRLLLR